MSKAKEKQTAKRAQCITAKDCGITDVRPATPALFANYVRTLLQNWRQGTVGSKGRSDVSLTNKKPWKQKGTGRARAGSARSPLWRGGGVVFGPQKRSKQLTMNKKMRKKALQDVLNVYLSHGKVVQADWHIDGDKPSTKAAHTFLKEEGMLNKKNVLFLAPGDMLTYASFSNIPNVSILYFDQPNVFDLANSDQWIVLKKNADQFKEMVVQWL